MSEYQEKYIYYTVDQDSTLQDIVSEKGSLFSKYYASVGQDILLKQFLQIKKDISNLDRIWNNYTQEEQDQYTQDYANQLLSNVKRGTTLIISESESNIDTVFIKGKNLFLEQNDLKSYMSEIYKVIQNDQNNFPSNQILDNNRNVGVQLKHYNCSVWMYSRALDKIKDVSSFIYNLTTTTGQQGGQFSITLEGIRDIESLTVSEGVVNYNRLDVNSDRIYIDYFSKYFQQKDVVWIRFEKLELEKRRNTYLQNFDISKGSLSGNVYDMIGLIDSISPVTNFSSVDKTVTITGRDLTWLLVEDESKFYPVLFSQGGDGMVLDTNNDSKWFKRNCLKGGVFESFFTFSERSIQDSIGFIINQLSNLGIVPDDLFTGYKQNNQNLSSDNSDRSGDRRTKALKISGDTNIYTEWIEAKGVWQIIDIFIDNQISNRRQTDSLLQIAEGSIMSMINSTCQYPFVEFIGDTYADKYVFQARQPIFTEKAIKDFIQSNAIIEIESKDVLMENLMLENEFYTSFELQPNSSFLGFDKFTALDFIPIIFFTKIAEMFGNKPYVISDSYLDYGSVNDFDTFRSGAINDFIYIIDIFSYLMFTRRGTITVNGDRRIKKGTWIYYKPTTEYFYVDSVINLVTFNGSSIDRTTTLSLKRGMVKDYLFGKSVSDNDISFNASYFNLVDTKLIKTKLENLVTQSNFETNINVKEIKERTTARFDINEDVFDFFVSKKQFSNL